MTTEAQKELRAFWKNVKNHTLISINEFEKLAEIFAKVDTKIERRIKQLEKSRDMWKEKWRKLKNEN